MSPGPADFDDEDIRNAILSYLAEHPQAMETLDGIAEWWVPRHRIRVDVERLSRAIRQLTEQGVLEELGAGSNRRYRLKTPPGGKGSR